MGVEEATRTIQSRLFIESGNPEWLHDARLTAREISNETIDLKRDGYNRTEIQREVDRDDFLRNNKCAVVGKALQTWTSYKRLLDWWHNQDDTRAGKPSPPSTDEKGAYPLVMAHEEGYELSIDEKEDRVDFRISPKPYKKVRGHLRARKTDIDQIKNALENDNWSVGQAELLYRDGVYYLHVTVTTEFAVPDPEEESDTLVGVDINERNVALTALDRDTHETLGTLVIDYGSVKARRQWYHTVKRRCQEHGQTSILRTFSDKEERYTEWVLHRMSLAVVEFSEQFSNPVIVFEDLSGIRDAIEYGTYMNRRLHKLPFHKFEDFVRYKALWREIPCDTVDAYHNSKSCSCCGERGYRQGRRFRCTSEACAVTQDHADRNASVNVAWRAWAKYRGIENVDEVNYRTHKTQPQVRLVRLFGSGRVVSRPSSSARIAERGVLAVQG